MPDAGLRATGRGPKDVAGSAPPGLLQVLTVLGAGDDGVPAAAADASYRQLEAGRKEERAQARPLRREARTTAAAAERGAGRRAAPARTPRAPPRPAHPPALPIGLIGRRREQGGRSRAAPERAGGVDPAGVGTRTPGASVFRHLSTQDF